MSRDLVGTSRIWKKKNFVQESFGLIFRTLTPNWKVQASMGAHSPVFIVFGDCLNLWSSGKVHKSFYLEGHP